MGITQFLSIVLHMLTVAHCDMEAFVVHGKDAAISNFPHSAFLGIKCVDEDNFEESFMCGASVLNEYLTLTAAHCTHGCTRRTVLTITVGSEFKRKGYIATADKFINHNGFSHELTNDIGLVRLKSPLTLNAKVSRVALMADPPYNEVARIAGWGLFDLVHNKYPNKLKFTNQYVRSKNSCRKLLKSKHIKEGTFCASNKNGYTAKGDSGSALVVRGYIQIGIVSYKLKYPTKKNQNVAVYTDTGYFYNWIREYARKIMCT